MKSPGHKIAVACTLLVVALGVGLSRWTQGCPPPSVHGGLVTRPELAEPNREDGMPTEFYRQHPRGSRTPMRLPAVGSGIPLGDGTFVPPLNGVRVEDVIPPVRRNRRLPPPGPIVAKIVDLSGQEWWEHEDGSQTSCSFASVTIRGGRAERIVSTQHGAVTPRKLR